MYAHGQGPKSKAESQMESLFIMYQRALTERAKIGDKVETTALRLVLLRNITVSKTGTGETHDTARSNTTCNSLSVHPCQKLGSFSGDGRSRSVCWQAAVCADQGPNEDG